MLALVVAAIGPSAGGARTPAQKCAVAKARGALKRVRQELRCHQRAYELGTPVDPACLDVAKAKLERAIVRAERGGGCVRTGDGDAIREAVGGCVDDIASRTFVQPASSSECCEFVGQGVCSGWLSPNDCALRNGIMGMPASRCDGGTGRCTLATTTQGPCCEIAFGPDVEGCYGGPNTSTFAAFFVSGTCTENGFQVVAGVCTPHGCE